MKYRRLTWRRKLRFNPKRSLNYLLLFLVLGVFSIGYAYLTVQMDMSGTAQLRHSTWDVHFANIELYPNNVETDSPATIVDNTTVEFGVSLQKPGESYIFTIDMVNAGTIDAMIDSVEMTPTLTPAEKVYLTYQITYEDGLPLEAKHLLRKQSSEKLLVVFRYNVLTEMSDYPQEDQSYNISCTIHFVQKDDTAVEVPHQPSFADASWEKIVSNVRSGIAPEVYSLGDTKEVDLGSLGKHMVRIANMSSPAECETTGFSQTACGFVLEFADSLGKGMMMEDRNNTVGWTGSIGRTYVNDTVYNALPDSLKSIVIDTYSVSGHGLSVTNNFTATDKLYLLTVKEIYDVAEQLDTGASLTRQLDYYQNIGASPTNTIIKQYNGVDDYWWLRPAYASNNISFYCIWNDGSWLDGYSSFEAGYSPAFRIG